MVKKAKRAAVAEPSPPSSSYPVGEEARARWKHQSLMQDYEDLLKETEAKKKKLQMTIEKKHKLMAEVEFLRRKYKSFSNNPTQETQFRVKKQYHKIPSTTLRISRPHSEVPSKDKNQRVKEVSAPAPAPRTSGLLDLNQSAEEMQELQEWESTEAEKLRRCTASGEGVANDINLFVCRDAGSNSSRVGKRKISWQDPVALRV